MFMTFKVLFLRIMDYQEPLEICRIFTTGHCLNKYVLFSGHLNMSRNSFYQV